MKNALYLLIALALCTAVYFLVTKEDTSTIAGDALIDFAIEDTSAIGSIYIADRNNFDITLSRDPSGWWKTDEGYRVMPYQIDLLMKTFQQTGVQQPVSKSAREEVLKIISGDNRKVKIMDRQGNWMKTWYVARATRNNQGTYAILETPSDGLSKEPVVLELRGFRGYLTSRFHTRVNDWRWTGAFYYPDLDISRIDVRRPRSPLTGYSVVVKDVLNGEMSLVDEIGRPLDQNPSKVRAFVKEFAAKYIEHFEPVMTELEKDSLLAIPPDYLITVTNTAGEDQEAKIYLREISDALREKAPHYGDIDPERVNMYINGEWVSAQRHTWDAIMIDREQLLSRVKK